MKLIYNAKNPKSTISLLIHLSKVGSHTQHSSKTKIYAAVDGNTIDIQEFGITINDLNKIGEEIEKILNKE